MAWIELHQAVWTHRKTLRLAAELDIDETYAAAHVIRLWTWGLDNAQDGDLTGLPEKMIAFGAGWHKAPSKLVAALVTAGWLDQTPMSLRIHDWDVYVGRLIEYRRHDAERKRNGRRTSSGASDGQSNGTSTGQAAARRTVGHSTVPTVPTVPTVEREEVREEGPFSLSPKGKTWFDDFMDAYPKRQNRMAWDWKAGFAAWKQNVAPADQALAVRAAENYAQTKDVADGVVFAPEKFLALGWQAHIAAPTDAPHSGNGAKPTPSEMPFQPDDGPDFTAIQHAEIAARRAARVAS